MIWQTKVKFLFIKATNSSHQHCETRKLCYRKDDRAMRGI